LVCAYMPTRKSGVTADPVIVSVEGPVAAQPLERSKRGVGAGVDVGERGRGVSFVGARDSGGRDGDGGASAGQLVARGSAAVRIRDEYLPGIWIVTGGGAFAGAAARAIFPIVSTGGRGRECGEGSDGGGCGGGWCFEEEVRK
jgi:hypothetical protein